MNAKENIFNLKILSRITLFSLISYILNLSSSFAQVEVHAVLDTNVLRIGEQTRLDIYMNFNAKQEKNISI
jgi:hypothetical protein